MPRSVVASALLVAALALARMGFRVLPLRERGKPPLTRHGVKNATTNVDQIHSWWARWPRANVGLAVPPGYLVLDLDNPEALHRLRSQDLALPTTATAITGRGLHLWYATGTATISNSTGLFQGVDIKTKGGYVVAPPSIHPNGTAYRWKVELQRSKIAECPKWLLDKLGDSARPRGRSAEDWYQKISSPVPEGGRNQALAEVAGLLFRLLPAVVAAELAYCWAKVKLVPPLPDAEVGRTIDSIAGRELRRRRERK